MTIGVLWEFFEFGKDQIIGYDMQKDTVIHTIRSVMLDPAGRNVPYVLDGIRETAVNGRELGLGGYLDIGLIDTMEDLIVNFIGAFLFSVIGFFYVKTGEEGDWWDGLFPAGKRRTGISSGSQRKTQRGRKVKISPPEQQQEESAEDCGRRYTAG